METEVNILNWPSSIMLVKRNGDLLDHTVYRNPLEQTWYLHKLSNHHQAKNRGIIGTLANRARRICANDLHQEELSHLNKAFLANGYNDREIKAALAPRERRDLTPMNRKTSLIRPSFHMFPRSADRISVKFSRSITSKPYTNLPKNKGLLKTSKRQKRTIILCRDLPYTLFCGSVYIGTTKRSVGTRLTEHKRNCRLGQTEKSAVAEHALRDGDHKIQFEDTQVIATTSGYHPRLVTGKLLKFTNIQIISTGRKKLSTLTEFGISYI
ncbi:uncharacterized protein LOC115885286 [Sitophilus oryzae]|uniref:Uncharacterized protein LOC115885286 n=1 Tax=Sitophilus oryzae TaxID=7048 RepID=A0A6J2Y9X7_SITOR|nr:uncharacterized protein LOC115885286 [Sitophilus oryzae]